jgi:hypothetical protein
MEATKEALATVVVDADAASIRTQTKLATPETEADATVAASTCAGYKVLAKTKSSATEAS